MSGSEDDASSGTHQNIARTSAVLTVLSQAGTKGARLTDVIAATALSKTAVHRCLSGLTTHGLAEFDRTTGRFFLGDRVFLWTRAAAGRFELIDRVTPYLQRLADVTEDTAYFMMRRGDEAVCFGRAVGAFPIKTLTLDVGDRRPLGLGTGSLALLAFSDEADIERVLATGTAARSSYAVGDEELRRLIAKTRQDGFAGIDGHIMAGMSGIGVPVVISGRPLAAVSIAAISSRLSPPRRDWAVERVREEAALIAQELGPLLSRS